MIQFIIPLTFLIYTTAIVVNQKNQCLCTDYKNQYECALNQQCIWNTTNCIKKSCGDFYYPLQCKNKKECFYYAQNSSCLDLTNCSSLNSTSTSQCESQSSYCGMYNSTAKECYSLTTNPCSQYTTQSECLYSGQGQLCLWENTQCQDFNCTLLDSQTQCQTYNLYCTWILNNQTCVSATCDNKPTSECTLFLSRNNNSTYIQPCYVDYSEKPAKCRDASLSDLSPFTCSLNTLNFATWNNVELDSGSCELCYAPLIQIISLAILIMIQ
ncbi:unnamed protein product [Paramecium pentaurelia]|uniref:Transmembrane protein n=1 Tax=Paramecium pentaurelia TaxID=43138 RepID=A0A8S1S033_9CILI|nr:unnamed protein product [Paramecium pentaurelia]